MRVMEPTAKIGMLRSGWNAGTKVSNIKSLAGRQAGRPLRRRSAARHMLS